MNMGVASRSVVAVDTGVRLLAIFWQIFPGNETIRNLRESLHRWD